MNSTSLSFLSPLLSLSQASLLVHPDKCAHPRAQDAFEVLNAAVAVLRGTGGGTPEEGAARLKELRYVLDYCKDQVLAARAASLKSDAVARLAATVVEGGADAVQAAWEASDAFREAWQAKARDVLARTAFKRQKLVARLKEAAHREEAEAAAVSAEARAAATASKKWEADREARVGTWRDFARGGGDKDTGGGPEEEEGGWGRGAGRGCAALWAERTRGVCPACRGGGGVGSSEAAAAQAGAQRG